MTEEVKRDDILRLKGITKSFGAIDVLHGVDMHLGRGEVLGLIGDNGAGKSTLVKIISGYHQPDEGTIDVDGEEVSFRSVDHARSVGVDTVYQDLALVDGLSVYHNMFLKRELVKKPLPFLSNREMRKRSREALDAIGIQTIKSVDQEVARLSGGQRQAIAVARSVSSNPKILLLDEPLAAMGVKEGAMILDLVRRLKAEGKVSIIMIAHKTLHVLETCDRVNMIREQGLPRQEDGGHVGGGADGGRGSGVPGSPAVRLRGCERLWLRPRSLACWRTPRSLRPCHRRSRILNRPAGRS